MDTIKLIESLISDSRSKRMFHKISDQAFYALNRALLQLGRSFVSCSVKSISQGLSFLHQKLLKNFNDKSDEAFVRLT